MSWFDAAYGFGPTDARGWRIQWIPNESGKLSTDSKYKALIQLEVWVDSNKKDLENEDPANNKKIVWYLRRGVSSPKTTF
jgi:hypothetical protein